MTKPYIAKNQDRVWRRIISVLQYYGSERAATLSVGAATPARMKRRVWLSAGTPDTGATGQVVGDFILDITGDEVLRYISSDTFVNLTDEA